MSARPWKRTERAIATRLGGPRVPVTGRQRGDVPDVAHEAYAVEVKHRKTLPHWLRVALAQAVAAQRGSQLPMVILHQAGTRHADDLVVLRLADFEDWNGRLFACSTLDTGVDIASTDDLARSLATAARPRLDAAPTCRASPDHDPHRQSVGDGRRSDSASGGRTPAAARVRADTSEGAGD